MGQHKRFKFLTLSFLFLLGLEGTLSRKIIFIDVQSDIPNDGRWTVNCTGGYGNLPTDINCLGGVGIPFGDLNGERGFWTYCEPTCELRYQIQAEDFSIKVRVYQSGRGTTSYYLHFDQTTTHGRIQGQRWGEASIPLYYGGQRAKYIRVVQEHEGRESFSVLDKLVVNGDLDSPPTTTTTEPARTTSDPECQPPEFCSCCDKCPQKTPTTEIHNHYYNYNPLTQVSKEQK